MVGGSGQILFTFLHKKIACEMILRKESTALHLIFHSIEKISILMKILGILSTEISVTFSKFLYLTYYFKLL